VRRNAALAAGAVVGAAAATLFRRRRPSELSSPATDPRAEDLRRRLDEARRATLDEDEFQAAGMGAETALVDEDPALGAPAPDEAGPPRDEFEAMRRRVHEEGRAAAEQMRRRVDDGGTAS